MNAIRAHILPLVFGVSMMVFGCSSAQWDKAATTYDAKISPPTTQAAVAAGQIAGIVATTVPGTPIGNAAGIVAAVAGLILTLDKVVSGTLHTVAAQKALAVPVPVAMTAPTNPTLSPINPATAAPASAVVVETANPLGVNPAPVGPATAVVIPSPPKAG